MTRRILFVSMLWVGLFAHAQNKQLLYDFTEVPRALMLNPGMGTDFRILQRTFGHGA